MNMMVYFVFFWIGIVAILSLILIEQATDRQRDRMFFRQLQNERRRMAERYGFRLRD